MATADFSWSDVDLGDDPRLIVGRRNSAGALEGSRVDLHDDTFAVIREIATNALETLTNTVARPYEPFAELEDGEEHFELSLEGPAGSDSDDEVADVTRLIMIVDDLRSLDARNLRDQTSLFYAICWPASGTGFVRKADPARGVRHGRYFAYRDALRKVDEPDLMLYDTVDFVIHDGHAGILKPTPFRTLFADVHVALAEVPNYVDAVRTSLTQVTPMSDASAAALLSVVSSRTSFAARLRRLSIRMLEVTVTRESIELAAARHLDDPSALLVEGEVVFDATNVPVFLDLLEGRLFEDDFTGERRRADRWSTR